MSHIVLKELNINNIIIKNTYSSYRLYYDESFPIKGIPFHCKGEIKEVNNYYKFYIQGDETDNVYKLNNYLTTTLKDYNGFINKDDNGNYLYFSMNYYINDKIKQNSEGLHLNIKYINKNNYNTVIHII